jgi:hypothetical protein
MADELQPITVYFRDGKPLHYRIGAAELERLISDFVQSGGGGGGAGAYEVWEDDANVRRKLIIRFDQVRNFG